MHYFQNGPEVEITGLANFDLQQTFDCGQCFRWNPAGDDAYIGVARGRAARIRRDGESVFITGTTEDFVSVWQDYFDLGRDYASIRQHVSVDDYMTAAAAFGAGIRILQQDPWEALCSFILSQCNNIPRIKKITEQLCRMYGEPISFENSVYYSFPAPERIALLSPEDLAPCRCGYRAESVLGAARAVSDGSLDLEQLAQGTPEDALASLKKLRGIGDKVASCVILFGLHMLDAFPIDTWIRKAIDAQYGKGFDPYVFSPYAGIAQQYMFYYARSGAEMPQSA
jgi:N-glycosylase/DNA lyase